MGTLSTLVLIAIIVFFFYGNLKGAATATRKIGHSLTESAVMGAESLEATVAYKAGLYQHELGKQAAIAEQEMKDSGVLPINPLEFYKKASGK